MNTSNIINKHDKSDTFVLECFCVCVDVYYWVLHFRIFTFTELLQEFICFVKYRKHRKTLTFYRRLRFSKNYFQYFSKLILFVTNDAFTKYLFIYLYIYLYICMYVCISIYLSLSIYYLSIWRWPISREALYVMFIAL